MKKPQSSLAVTLRMATSGQSPSNANNYLTQSWDRRGYTLGASASVLAPLMLTASTNTGSLSLFSYNIAINGTQ